MPTSALREYVRTHAENRPGVYRMLDADGDPLYVGKSIGVRTRLLIFWYALTAAPNSSRVQSKGPTSLAPHDAAEILLLTRWFELRPKELKRTGTPKKWLASGGIRTGALV